MSFDPTESIRRAQKAALDAQARTLVNPRVELEARYGKVWTTDEMRADFDALGFQAPYIVVARKSDGQKGSLMFTGSPRFYFSFDPYTH